MYHQHECSAAPRRGGATPAAAALLQRDDDREDVARERLRVYRQRTEPLLDLYRSRGALRQLDGSARPDDVYARVREAMRRKRA